MALILPQTHSDEFYEEAYNRIRDIFNNCSETEQGVFLKILQELSDYGASETLDKIYLVDFKEVPVSIDRFLCDSEYLGESNDNGNQIYPGWWDAYHTVFDSQKDIYEVLLSGATRIGKTSSAVSMMAYMTYLLMCYRNPQKYFGLKGVSRATIAFANLTKDLALGVAYREYHDTLIKSPWFMRHGTKNNSATKPIFIPEGNQIEIVAASDGAHLLGMQLWACLTGDTRIATDHGVYTISDLSGKHINVKQYNYLDNTFTYTAADVVQTKLTTELISIELEDGTVIKGTPEHRIMLADGRYKMLKDLTEDDDIMTPNNDIEVIESVKLVIGDDYKNHGVWKFIPDGTNHHAICSTGDMVVRIPYLDTIGRKVCGKVLSFSELSGYYIAMHQFVHRLMILTFKPEIWDSGLDVNHIDGNKHNNNISNLEMVTRSENLHHFWNANCFEDKRNAILDATRIIKSQRAKGNTYGKGRKHIHRGDEHTTCLVSELPIYLSQGWEIGTNIKTKSNTGMIWITDGSSNKMVSVSKFNTMDLNVWRKGLTRPKNTKVWVHMGDRRLKILKSEIDYYLSEGWELGSNVVTMGNSGKVTITDGVHNKMIPISELANIQTPWRRGQTKKGRTKKL